jgi:hypothetical protein
MHKIANQLAQNSGVSFAAENLAHAADSARLGSSVNE